MGVAGTLLPEPPGTQPIDGPGPLLEVCGGPHPNRQHRSGHSRDVLPQGTAKIAGCVRVRISTRVTLEREGGVAVIDRKGFVNDSSGVARAPDGRPFAVVALTVA